MIPLVQTIVAWFLIISFLPRIKRANSVTTNTWLFLILFSLSTTLQVDSVYNIVNNLLGVNHIAWPIGYISGIIALYAIYKALCIIINPSEPRPNKWFYWATVFATMSLVALFPAITVQPTNAANADSLWALLFLVIPYSYATVISFTLSGMFYQCQQKAGALHLRVRWMLLAVSVFLGAMFFAIRLPYFVAVFIYPGLAQTPFADTLSQLLDFLALARASWVFFFIPNKVYQTVCIPVVFISKLATLKQLETLRTEANSLLARTELLDVQYSWQEQIRNLDFLIYRAIISILDAKRTLNTLNGDWPHDDKRVLLEQILNTVSDERDFDSLIAAYRTASKQFQKTIS